MTTSSTGLHEPADRLEPATVDRHRAFVSLTEELEAADWYDQRVDAVGDAELGAILAHNRDEEKEHAAMLLEWLRRHDASLDEHLRTYLFADGEIVGIEAHDHADDTDDVPGGAAPTPSALDDRDLGVGTLRESTRPEEVPS